MCDIPTYVCAQPKGKFRQFIDTISSKSLHTDRHTETNHKWVQMPRFFHRTKCHKNNPIAIQAKRTENNNKVCVL